MNPADAAAVEGSRAARPTYQRRLARARSLLLPYPFLLPAGLAVLAFFLLPAVIVIVISVTDMSTVTGLSNWTFTGLENYQRILQNPDTSAIATATVVYCALTLAFNVGFALVLALLVTSIPEQAGLLFRAIWLLPRITPVAVYVLMWKFIAAIAPYGILNQHLLVPILHASGRDLISVSPWPFVILCNGAVGVSFGMIIFTSAITAIPADYLNAAAVDGAGLIARARYVILPLLRWPILFVAAYQTLSLLTSFEYILLLTGGESGTQVWSLWAYQTALSAYYGNLQYGFGSALAVILVAIGIAASLAYLRWFRFSELLRRPGIEVG